MLSLASIEAVYQMAERFQIIIAGHAIGTVPSLAALGLLLLQRAALRFASTCPQPEAIRPFPWPDAF